MYKFHKMGSFRAGAESVGFGVSVSMCVPFLTPVCSQRTKNASFFVRWESHRHPSRGRTSGYQKTEPIRFQRPLYCTDFTLSANRRHFSNWQSSNWFECFVHAAASKAGKIEGYIGKAQAFQPVADAEAQLV